MKNIAFVIHSLNSGGAERVVSTLANNLSHHYNVTIITFVKIEPFYKLDNRVILQYCQDHIPPSQNIFQAIKSNIGLYNKISHFTKKSSVDLLIGFMTQANVLTILAGKINKVPVIISERNNPKLDYTPKLWKALKRIIYPLTNKLVVQTKPVEEYYKSHISNDKIEILPNPIAKSYTEVRFKKNGIKKENIILNVGRLSHQKGQEIAIRAFAQLNLEDWQLYLIGEGPRRKEYEQLIEKLDMSSNIKLLGRVKNVASYYLKSKLFVFPSRYEGFPNALTEAMYMGLPCVATACPNGPSELIRNNINGYLIPVDDIGQLKRRMIQLIGDDKMRDDIGKKAQVSVSYLEEENISNDWRDLINKALKI